MQVFKLCFKIIKKNVPVLLIYVFVFIGVAVIMSKLGTASNLSNFTESKCSVAFINRDSDSALIRGLKAYIGEH